MADSFQEKISGEVMPYQDQVSGEVTPYQGIISGEIRLPDYVGGDPYVGDYEFIPTFDDQIVPTNGKIMSDDITFKSIQTFEVSNEAGGLTFSI